MELYLINNFIFDLNQVKYLKNCPLKILFLIENPISTNLNYEYEACQNIKNLSILDGKSIHYL